MPPARLLRVAFQRLRSLSRKDKMDAELEKELAFLFEQLVKENTADGMAPDEARKAASRTLGNFALLEEQCRDQRRVSWLHDLWQDALYGLRMLRNHPGFTAIAVGSLALGIGANTAVLGAIDSVLLGSLPFPNASRLVLIHTFPLDDARQNNSASLPDYLAWKDQCHVFEAMGASLNDQRDFGAEEDGTPAERIAGQGFSPDLFQTLGVQPMLGRVFTDAEDLIDHQAPVVVISHRLWQQRFGADPNILNKQVRLNGVTTAIIGVMPPDFRYSDGTKEYWVPLPMNRLQLQGSARYFVVVARLKAGATLAEAQADLDAVAARLAKDFPDRHKGWGVRVQTLHDSLFGWTKEPLFTLQAAVALVLLIACANVAGLLVARGAVRTPEMAMRVALGAGRGRIVRQLLTESVLLSVAGGALGILVSWWGLRGLVALGPPPGSPRIGEIDLSFRMLSVSALLSVVTGLVFGVLPALDSSRARTRSSRHRLRGALVAAQIALALVLLAGSGLMMKSFLRLSGRELNFDPQGLLTFEVRIPSQEYTRNLGSYRGFPYHTVSPPPSRTMERIYNRLRALPGAESVAGTSYVPVNSLILPVLNATLEDHHALSAAYFLVTPNFFATLKTPLIRGRDFDDRDTLSRPWVAVINETTARRFWPGQDPIGKRFTLDVVPEEQPREVIGVVRDIPTQSQDPDPAPVIYASYLQQPARYRGPFGNMFGQMTFVLRTGNPLALLAEARRAVAEVDPDRPLANIATMQRQFGGFMRERGYYVLVLGVFAFAATLLAAIGIYGVMAYSVAQRTHEIGIRMALGASAREVVKLVGRRALLLISAGLVLGLAGSLALTRLIASQLWGVTPTDPATFAAVSLLLAVVALLACFVPARRAIRVDPTVALRSE